MTKIDGSVLDLVPLAQIDKVTFYKRNELTTDLICCDVAMGATVRTFHEDLTGWEMLLQHLYKLPGFLTGWFASVSQPAFETNETVALERSSRKSSNRPLN